MNAKPISEPAKTGAGCFVVFGLVFFLVGVFVIATSVVMPFLSAEAASDWRQIPCQILSSDVDVRRGDEKNTYLVDIEYEYDVGNQTYQSSLFEFNNFSRSRKECAAIVRRYPAGQAAVCFVDPDDPENSVLDRTVVMAWGNLIFGLIFSTIGAAIAFCLPFLVNRKNTKNKPIDDSGLESVDGSALAGQGRSITSAIYPDDLEDQKWDGPQRLKPKSTKVGTLIGMTFFALFWNGIVSIFVSKALLGGQMDGFSIFLCLFLIPFALVGCLLIVGVFKAFLGLFNPVIEVALSSGAIARGSEVDVAWEVKGNAGRIHRLQIAVIGTETARYQQGTDTVTAQSEFGFVEIVDTTNMDEISFGSLAIVIPADTMHTFSDRNNNVTWAIRVNGEIKRWPNVVQSHVFRVKP